MKKKTKLLIALLLVFVGVGLTYAVYTTSVGGNANVEAANWLIKVKVNNTETDVSNGSNNVSLGSCQKLAPGGSCTLPFRVDATGTEVDTILTVELGNNVTGATLEELTNAGINLRISDGVNEDYAYLLNMGSYKDLNLVINWEAGDEDDDTKAGYDVSIANKLSSITIPVNMIVKQRLGGLRTVIFNTHDSNIQTPESIQVNDGESILEADIPVLVKNGYIFDGWYTSEVGGTKLTSSTIIIDNIEYHARFREPRNVTVTFNTHGGSNVNSVSVSEGGTLSELPSAPTRLGYTFAGWYTAETGGEAVTTSTVINNTTEFHAQWTIKYVSVTFNSNGGSSVTSPVQVQEGGTINPLPVSTMQDNELVYWYNSNNEILTTSTQIMNDVTYTAFWKISNFEYSAADTVKIKEFKAPVTGTYQLEVWGAQGGTLTSTYRGGYGGYSTGEVELIAGETYYVVPGGQGESTIATESKNYGGGGYNGGGTHSGYSCSTCSYYSAGGGGATHIATESGLLSNFSSVENQQKVLIVAGGGGGNGYTDSGWNVNSTNIASGGGISGNKGNPDNVHNSATLATQNTGNAIGQGQNCGNSGVCDGGGGGWYGGYNGTNGASGGSGYLKSTLTNKSMYCYSCQEDDNIGTYTTSTYGTTTHSADRDLTNCPNGYSENPISKCAKAGNGYARITYIGN